MELFLTVAVGVALIMLVWDCVEVGRNDAANLVNAVFGARVMTRKTAVYLAGAAVVLGATFASPVMETARKGIFDPGMLTIELAMTVYITAYIVDTALLYTYSAFGMPVSTTASLVFELVGASIAVASSLGIVQWAKVSKVLTAILMSIILAGIAGFLFMRMFRAAIREQDDEQSHMQTLLHGPWMTGLMLTWLSWFMLMKGLKAVPAIKSIKAATIDAYGAWIVLILLWGFFTLLVHMYLTMRREKGTKSLFSYLAILGMICLAFAFGQNDLANCASPGLASLWLWLHQSETTVVASKVPIPMWALFGCGVLMVLGMTSKNAQRVTRAAVNTGSQYDHIALYAPKWCRKLAKMMVRKPHPELELAPEPERTEEGKRLHFDPLRASVIMAVSASVIAFASGQGLPVSTTYVTFAAVVATGMADRSMTRGDYDRKIGRAIWVVFSWFAGALLAMVSAFAVAFVIMKLSLWGLVICIGANLGLRVVVKKRSDLHEKKHHEEASLVVEQIEAAEKGEAPKA